jgi:hypothetical protein
VWRDSDFVDWAHAAGERPRCGQLHKHQGISASYRLATHKVPIGVIEMLFDRSTIGPSDEARWESAVHADYNLGSRLHGTPAIADFVSLGALLRHPTTNHSMHASTPVPGSLQTATVLLDGPEVPYGLTKLRNTGSYGLAVGALDAYGNLLQPHIYLEPGDALSSFIPPANAVQIVLVGQKQEQGDPPISGTAELDYDVPWYS